MNELPKRSGRDIVNLMFLPNNKCNFRCSYCYSAKGRSGKEVSLADMKKGIDYFFDMHKNDNLPVSISVAGGGEPILSWNVMREALDYAYAKGEEQKKALPTCFITNGSIYTEEFAQYAYEHGFFLMISFDILPDIQAKQRGHYDLVLSNIQRYIEKGISVAYSTVITAESVNRIEEMIDEIYNKTPDIKEVIFKTVISPDYFSTPAAYDEYLQAYKKNFFAAKEHAKNLGMNINVTGPFYNNTLGKTDRYCQPKFIITSEGTISLCPFASSKQDVLYDEFAYGQITDNGVTISQEKLSELVAHNHDEKAKCKECIAYWYCAGGCYVNNLTIGEDYLNVYCKNMQLFVQYVLQKRKEDNSL